MAESLQQPSDVATEYAAMRFVIESLMSRLATCTLVRVVACTNDGGVSPVGTVDVQPLVNQIAGNGSAMPHGQLYKLPYVRAQGGTSAIILDPKPGDLGLACFASRDISAIKSPTGATQARASGTRGLNPGSKRQYNMSDGLYVGGLLNAVPTQYVRFSEDGVTVVSPDTIRLQAPTIELDGDVVQTGGDITATGSITADGDVTGEGVSLHDHVHSGVTAGGGTSGPPVP
jgi:hypothetical protein